MKFRNLIYTLALLIPLLLAFRTLFLPSEVVWGDAPYIHTEDLKELISEPYAWVSRGSNFGGVNQLLWLSPIMFLYGILGAFFNLPNSIILKILFYIPSLAFSLLGTVLIGRYLKLGKIAKFFLSFIYLLNTYFLLLVDGGQVGVALSYGFFPISVLFVKKLFDKPHIKNLYIAITFLFLTFVADPRIGMIVLLTGLLWFLSECLVERDFASIRNLVLGLPLLLGTIALSFYWVLPTFKFMGVGGTVSGLNLNTVSLINPLFLFQPLWYFNQFGKVFPPPFYFAFVPTLVFAGLFLKSKKQKEITSLVIVFLVFSFLTKGASAPLGSLYEWVLENIPFSLAFRDSSKFFMPVVLFAGILIGKNVEVLYKKADRYRYLVLSIIYVYFLILILPALKGDLPGVLSKKDLPNDIQKVNELIKKEPQNFFRTTWYPEKSPFSYNSSQKQSQDAISLVTERPFAALNAGEDPFNYMNTDSYLKTFDLLGIRYLVFSGNPRTTVYNSDEDKKWKELMDLASETTQLQRVNTDANIPVFVHKDSQLTQHISGYEKIYAVIGADSQELLGVPAIYLEDGKFEPAFLQGISPESLVIVLNQKKEEDLAMSVLQKYFIPTKSSIRSNWSVFGKDEYLKWKYELLIRGVTFADFDFNLGLAFSTEPKEEISFTLAVPRDGEYFLAVRSLSDGLKNPLTLSLEEDKNEISYITAENFEWWSKQVSLKKGKVNLSIQNSSGIHALNVVALIPSEEMQRAKNLSTSFLQYFQVVDTSKPGKNDLGTARTNVNFEKVSLVRYKVEIPESTHWIVLSDSYSNLWSFKRHEMVQRSLPFDSMINTFYVEPKWASGELIFGGQKEVRWGIFLSFVSFMGLLIVYLAFSERKDE